MRTTPFTVPIFQYSIPNWESSAKNNILKALTPHLSGNTDYYNKGDWSASKQKPQYTQAILDIIDNSLMSFAEELGTPKDQLIIPEMWYEQLNKYDHHCCHNHGAIGYSACLYVHFNEKQHEATKFYGPYLGFLDGESLFFQPEVKEGDIVLFPSALNHEAPINYSDEMRIIVSFNIKSPLWG